MGAAAGATTRTATARRSRLRADRCVQVTGKHAARSCDLHVPANGAVLWAGGGRRSVSSEGGPNPLQRTSHTNAAEPFCLPGCVQQRGLVFLAHLHRPQCAVDHLHVAEPVGSVFSRGCEPYTYRCLHPGGCRARRRVVYQQHIQRCISSCQQAPPAEREWRLRWGRAVAEVSKQAQEVVELINEITGIVLRSGPAGVARGFKAFEAVATTGQEWLQGDRPSPPALLRKLCERLGATYVKLGQFIASSPTLFPEEYVVPTRPSRARAPTSYPRVCCFCAHTRQQRQRG